MIEEKPNIKQDVNQNGIKFSFFLNSVTTNANNKYDDDWDLFIDPFLMK